jgi:hypothetical protein
MSWSYAWPESATLPDTIAVSPKPTVPRCWMNVAQEIVARLYVAGPVVSDPPELIGLPDGVANPAGKSVAGGSTDSSCVPVSCPVAAASGVVGADGVAAEDPGVPAAPEVAGAAVTEADGAGAVADDELADEEDEHPATVRSTPVIAASTAAAR